MEYICRIQLIYITNVRFFRYTNKPFQQKSIITQMAHRMMSHLVFFLYITSYHSK